MARNREQARILTDAAQSPETPGMARWGVYVLECRDGTLYGGVTNDLDARLRAHNAGTGAKYTRGRHPVTLAAFSGYRYTQGEALRIELIVKGLPRRRKVAYVQALPEPGGQGSNARRPRR